MLSSFRISSVKITVPLAQTQHKYCTATDRREKIIRTHTAQKQLFGEVIRNESRMKAKIAVKNTVKRPNTNPFSDASSKFINEMKVSANKRSCEFHYLVKKGKSSKSAIKITTFEKSGDKDATATNNLGHKYVPFEHETSNSSNHDESNASSREPLQSSQTSSTMNTRNAIISAKKLLRSFVTKDRTSETAAHTATQEIPFNMDELSSMVKYPIVPGKCSLSQTVSLTDKSVQIPSISKVLAATMPEGTRIALKKWKMAKIAELGADGFKQYEKETFNLGKQFHSAVEDFLNNGQCPDPDSSVTQLWQSVNPSLNELKPKVILSEQPIVHADLKYKGIIDNVSMVRDELCAFEWKTSEKTKPKLASTYDAPVQLCAYLGALNADPRYDMVVKNGRVVVAYKNGDLANVFELSETELRKYWLIWLQRLQEYWIRVKDGTLPEPI